MAQERVSRSICLVALLAAAIALCSPLVQAHSRYFYQEDDAHHFNHTVEMARNYTLNPNYFNKPALHFYLRMPIVYASAAWERLHGRLQTLRDIRTRDPYGVSDYAFTPSHPNILISNRWLSIFFTFLLSAFVFHLARSLHVAIPVALFGATATLISPEVLRNSYIIGVDTLMALACLICTSYAVRVERRRAISTLFICGLLAGLAGAAKYNAAPIVVVPLLLWWLCDRSARGFATIVGGTLCGFLIGAPYSLISYRDFWQGVSYEVWHYGVAGHEEHSGIRGLPQLLFYIRWLISDGVGIILALLSLLGARALWRDSPFAAKIIISFPLAYLFLMTMQRANFTRNMVVLVPYVALLGAYGLWSAAGQLWRGATRSILVALCIGISVTQLGGASAAIIRNALHTNDSRDEVVTWLNAERPIGHDVAVAGPLQLPFPTLSLPGVDTFDPSARSLASLVASGYRYVILPGDGTAFDPSLFSIERIIPGEPSPQRVPKNPAMTIARAVPFAAPASTKLALIELVFSEVGTTLIPQCPTSGEPHCWIQTIAAYVAIPAIGSSASLKVMSPWPHQHVELLARDGTLIARTTLDAPNLWEELVVPPAAEPRQLLLKITEVHSPASQGISKDTRRLGIAIKRS